MDTAVLGKKYAEEVDLAYRVPLHDLGVRMMAVRAGGAEDCCAVPKSNCLALDTRQPHPVIGYQVISCVLAEGIEQAVAQPEEAAYDRKGGPVTDALRMFP
ncbi:MAG TPA: hypothetical protein VMV08_03310 [Gaiellaceae bacterium]|nr:hypothetical protein [Gaiellaceae bacterium]